MKLEKLLLGITGLTLGLWVGKKGYEVAYQIYQDYKNKTYLEQIRERGL